MGLPFTIQKDAAAKGVKTDLIVNPDTDFGKTGDRALERLGEARGPEGTG